MKVNSMLIALTMSLLFSVASQAQQYAIVAAKDVKMRSTSSTSGTIEGYAQMGDLFEILEKTPRIKLSGFDTEYHWYHLKQGSKKGWVYGAFVFEQKEEPEIIQGSNNYLATFSNLPTPCEMDRCNTHILAVVPGNIKKQNKVRMIKYDKAVEASYRNCLGTDFVNEIPIMFQDKKGNIVLHIKAEYIVTSEATVYELKWNGSEYIAHIVYKASFN